MKLSLVTVFVFVYSRMVGGCLFGCVIFIPSRLSLALSLSPPQANLLSSHRSLVHRVETIALGDKPCDRGEHVTLFLFNDCLEVTPTSMK